MKPMRKPPQKQDQLLREQVLQNGKTEQRKKLLLQFKTVLELLIPHGKVKYEDFLEKFFVVTNSKFEMRQREIYHENDLSVSKMLVEIRFHKHQCSLEFENPHQMFFVFGPKTKTNIDNSCMQVSDTVLNKLRVDNESTADSNANQEDTKNLSDRLMELLLETTNRTEDNKKEMNPNENQKPTKECPDVYEMFSYPMWQGESAQFREENRDLYLNFLQRASNKPAKDASVQKEAKLLVQKWWAPRLRFFPQILYLLRQLSNKRPNGFSYTTIEDEIDSVIPDSWRVYWRSIGKDFSFDYLLTGISQLVSLNLIMSSDPDKVYMMKVNKVIDYVGFYEIHEPETSMIYQYVSSTPHDKTTKSVHTFMCDDYPGWTGLYDEKTSMDRIYEICAQEKKMFSTEYNQHAARNHSYKIVVPMIFSPCIVYTSVGVR